MTETTTGPIPAAGLSELATGPGTTTDSPFLPTGFTETFTSHVVDVGGLRLHAVLVSAARPELMILDTRDDAIVRTVSLTGNSKPAQIARYSPDGRYLVVTSVDEGLAVILNGDFSIRATVPVGRQPMDMAFAPDGETVVIANQGDGTLSVIDLPGGRVQRVVHVGEGVETLAYY